MSVAGMQGQMTVWFSSGEKHCWHLSDLINNECTPLFPLHWPKCTHTVLLLHNVIPTSCMPQRGVFIVFYVAIEVAISQVITIYGRSDAALQGKEMGFAAISIVTVFIALFNFRCVCVFEEEGKRRKRERPWHPEILPCDCQLSQEMHNVIPLRSIK